MKDFSELLLTYVRPSKKYKDFIKKIFLKILVPFSVLRFQVAVAVELGDRKAGYGSNTENSHYPEQKHYGKKVEKLFLFFKIS